MVDYGSIPELMCERDQWVCWKEITRDGDKTKAPVDPETGDFASSADSDTWSTFKQVRETHESDSVRTSGIGFMFSEHSMLMGVDLDDCRDPVTGEPSDEAVEIINHLDSWTEVSPSGTGYHVIVQGVVPDGGNRGDIDNTQHVEMYDKKRFFTVTGDRVDETPESVETRPEEVKTIHSEFIADDEDSDTDDDGNTPDPVGVDVNNEELIQTAKNSENGDKFESLWNGNTRDYGNDHSRADLALCSKLAFWTGGDKRRIDTLFRQSGLMRDKWDEDRGSQTYGERTIDKALKNKTEFYDPPSSVSKNTDADSSDSDTDTDDSDENDTGITAYSALDVADGRIGYWKTNNDDEDYFDVVCNFVLDTQSFLFRDGERVLKLQVIPATGEEAYDVEVPATVFNDRRKFKKEVVKGVSTVFDGSSNELNELRKLCGGQAAPQRTGTRKLGLHVDAGEFVTRDGVLTAAGWVDDSEHEFMSRGVAAERSLTLSEDDGSEYNAEAVCDIIDLLPKTRHSDRIIPVLGWTYAATLRPLIAGETGQFNSLHVTGRTGAGKSTTLELLRRMFGMNDDPQKVDDTKFALITSMSVTDSLPVWFDEYKPSDMQSWQLDRFQNLLRMSTRGSVAVRGNADKSTEEYVLDAPVVISGEQSIQGPAERRRTIQTRFRDDVNAPGSETKTAFDELSEYDLTEHAIAYFQWLLGQSEEELLELWSDAEDRVDDVLSTTGITGVVDLQRQGLQTIVFGMLLQREFAADITDDLDDDRDVDVASVDAVNAAVEYVAGQMGDSSDNTSHLDEFVELLCRAAREDYLENGKHHKLIRAGQDDEELAIKLSSAHDMVSKYVRDHDINSVDLLNAARDYKEWLREEVDDNDSYVAAVSQNTTGLNRCVRIDTSIAAEQLEFDSRVFNPVKVDFNNAVEAADDGDDNGDGHSGLVTVCDAVSKSETGHETVSVTVLDVEEFGDEHSAEFFATVQDESAVVKLVNWSHDKILEEGDTVRLRGVKIAEYEGTKQLVLDEKVTQVDYVQPGFGYTKPVGVDEDQTQTESSETALDSGVAGGD